MTRRWFIRRFVATIALLLTASSSVYAQAAHDASASGTYSTGTSFTWNHVYGASSIGVICVGYKFAAFESITGVTVGGSAATFVAEVHNAGGSNRLEMWKHEAPGSGSKAIVVSFNGDLSADSGSATGTSVSSTGASGWSAGTTAGPTVSTTPAVTVPSVGGNDMPYGCVFTGGDPAEQDTAVIESSAGGNFLNTARQTAGGNGVLDWIEGGGDEWLTIGTRAIASGGGGGSTCHGSLMLLRVGC